MLETQARIAEILAANNAIQKENIDRIAAVKTATDAITAEQGARVQAITQMGAGLTTEINKNKTALEDVNERTDTLVTKTGQNLAAIQEETRLRTAEDSALSGRITTLVAQTGDNATAILWEEAARASTDEAQGKLITALTTRTKNAETAITTETTARTTADTAIGKRVDAIKVTADGNSGLISSETSARVAADGVLTQRIGLAEAETTKAVGRIATVEQTSSDNKAAVAKVRTDLTAEFDNMEIGGRNLAQGTTSDKTTIEISGTFRTLISSVPLVDMGLTVGDTVTASVWIHSASAAGASIRINQYKEDGSYAWLPLGNPITKGRYGRSVLTITIPEGTTGLSLVLNNVGNGTDLPSELGDVVYSRLKLERGSKATDWSPAPEDTNSKIALNTAAITSESEARATADGALSKRIDTVTATAGANSGKIVAEAKSRADADSALTQRISNAESVTSGALGRITTVEKTASDNKSAVATLRTDLVASYTVQDTRATDELPSYYYTNYPRQTVREFKQKSVMTGVVGSGTYVYLETVVRWSSVSGGAIVQTAVTDDNRIYIRTSSSATAWRAWVEQEDVTGSAAKVAAAKLALDNRINTTDARVTSEKKVAADATSAVASTVGTLQTTVNGHTASIQTHQSSINGLNAQYTVKLDVGGRVSGFGIASSATRTDFAVNADYFWIAPPTGTAKGTKPFMVLTTATTINGTSVPAGTYIESAFIHNGSIDTAKIKDLSVNTAKIALLAVKTAQIDNLAVSTAKIANLAVKSAQIDNLAVTKGKIANLAVDTLQIAGNAVTVPLAAYTEADINIPSSNNTTQVQSIVVPNIDGDKAININFIYTVRGTEASSSSMFVYVHLGSTLLRTAMVTRANSYLGGSFSTGLLLSKEQYGTLVVTAKCVGNSNSGTASARFISLIISKR